MSEIPDILKDWAIPEELHPDLKPYLCEENGMHCLKHPLIFDIFYHEGANRRLNQSYLKKKEYLDKSRSEQNWGSYVWLHERPYRFEALHDIADEMSDEDYWSTLGDIWSDSENIWQQESLG